MSVVVQGTDDSLVPAAMSEYAKRLLPQVKYHKLEGEGHFSWFCCCDACHRELFRTLFGEVEGLDELDNPPAPEIISQEEESKVPVESGSTLAFEAGKLTSKEAEEGLENDGENIVSKEDL